MQNSGAQIPGFANAGSDFVNSLKTANQFGFTKKMKPPAPLIFITDIHSLGLETAQGLYLTTGWYWDLNDKTQAFAKRFFEKTNREPTVTQATYYSAKLTYLNVVKAAKTTDIDKVMAELHKAKIDDIFTSNGKIRPDGWRGPSWRCAELERCQTNQKSHHSTMAETPDTPRWRF